MPTPLAVTYSSSGQAFWYLTRSTGVVALLLLTAVVVLGALGPMRLAPSRRWPRFAVSTLHRELSLLVMVVLAIHIATSVIDGFAPIGWLDAVIPFGSPYRPLWLGFGALAFDLLVAVIVTSLIRVRLGYERWRAVHWLAYVSWPITVLHGLGTGSDTKQGWMLVLTAACVAVVLIAVVVRVGRGQAASDARAAWVALALLTPLGSAVFALVGPLQPGWAGRAGTPAKLLYSSAPKVTAARVGGPAAAVPMHAFSAGVSGELRSRNVAGGALIDLAMRLRGGASGRLRVRLAGAPLQSGGLSLTGSQVDLSQPALHSVLAGTVTSLNGGDIRAHVTGPGGLAMELRANLHIDQQGGTVSGLLHATPVGG